MARMRTGKGNLEEEDYGEDEFGSKRGPSSNSNNNNTAAGKDVKNSDRASAIRSKHSVTEQRRRSKINERFQILRELIPHSDQKRDTASFLLEVIEYVQYLQEKVQKYEASYPGWSSEPTKLMPWRNSHWRVQSFANHPQALNNGSGPATPFPGKFEENNMSSTPTIISGIPNQVESDPSRDVACQPMDRQPELENKGLSLPMPVQPIAPLPVHGVQSNECPATSDALSQSEDLVIEGGTVSISSVYSHELLSSLTQALEKAGIDLSQAKLSVQIDLGKRANQGLTSAAAATKNPLSENQAVAHPRDPSGEESDQTHKRLKT